MSQTQCIRIPLKPEGAEEFVEFARRISRNLDEVKAVLAEEGILAEAVFLDASTTPPAVILFTRAKDLQEANSALLASSHPIQVEMRELMGRAFDAELAEPLEVLLDMTGDIHQPPS
jgi:hypothetical protein